MWKQHENPLAAHGFSANYANVVTQTRLAGNLGYDSMEYLAEHVLRYLENGGTTAALKSLLKSCGLTINCINALQGVDRWEGEERKELLAEADRLITVAAELDCPVIQLNPSYRLTNLPKEKALDILVENIGAIAALGAARGLRFQLEPIAHSGMDTLKKAQEIICRLGYDNLGLVVDFWHIHASGQTTAEIAALDARQIFDVHLCDGRRADFGEVWDEQAFRSYLPGEGEIDLAAMAEAVRATGYHGPWAAELYHPQIWEWDTQKIFQRCLEDLLRYARRG